MRSIRDTAATKIAEAKKEIAEIVAKLKKDHTAEEAAPLLDLTVEQFNKILYNGRARSTPPQVDAAESKPAAEADAPDSLATTPPPSPPDNEPWSEQFTLFAKSDPTPAPSPTARPEDSQPFEALASDETATESTSPDQKSRDDAQRADLSSRAGHHGYATAAQPRTT
jgi:hypothetical protein